MTTQNIETKNHPCSTTGLCSRCPSNPAGHDQAYFCINGAGNHVVQKRGCNCPQCPFWIEKGLSGMYYCIKYQGK